MYLIIVLVVNLHDRLQGEGERDERCGTLG